MPVSPDARELIDKLRYAFLETFAKSDRSVIFTVVIDFNAADDIAFLEMLQGIFHKYNRGVLFVELETDIHERLRRNKTENRLHHKPIKRHLEWSERDILETANLAKFNPDRAPENLQHYYKINNTNLSAKEVARLILEEVGRCETKI